MEQQLELPLDGEKEDEEVAYKYKITSYGADYDVHGLVRRMKSGDIYVPLFQRKSVWKQTQKCRFIESLLLGLPVPGIFLSREDSEKLIVIDGQQRLRTLLEFYGDQENNAKGFELKDLESRFNGKSYKSLSSEDRRQLDNAIIHTTIIRQDEPDDGESSIYLIFQRLNTGGTALHPQEIRAALYHGKFNELLGTLNKNTTWRKLYGAPSPRKKDEELILRFFAFYFRQDKYEKPMIEFLNGYMNSNKNLTNQSKKQLASLFIETVETVFACLGDKAFKPQRALNVSAFDSIMVAIAKRLEKGKITSPEKSKKAYKKLIGNQKYFNAIRVGTSDEEAVKTRFSIALSTFEKVP
jgi:uncharacterized protein with ParB-like and HNH nuclease domain